MLWSFSGQMLWFLLFPALPTPTQLLHLLCIPPGRLTSFSALFVSLMRLLGRCHSLWFAGQLATRSSCDLRPGWRDIFIIHDKLEVQLPARFTSETCLASFLLHWVVPRQIDKNTDSFCVPRNQYHQNKPRSLAELWFSILLPTLPFLQSYGPSRFNAVLSC